MHNTKRLFRLLIPHHKTLMLASFFLAMASATNLTLPLYIKDLVDVVVVQRNLPALNSLALTISTLLLAQMLFSTLNNYLFDLTEKRIITDLRKMVFQHLQTLSLSFFTKRRTGEIVSRLTSDVAKIESIIVDLPGTALQQSIRLLGGIVIIIYMNWKLTFMILVLSPILVLFARFFGRKLRKLSTAIQDKLADSTIVLEENISGIHVVKSFVSENREYGRFSDAVEDSFLSSKKRIIIASFFGPTIGLIAFGTALILLWYGGREVILGAITPGELIAFVLYATIIAGPMGSFARMFTRLQEGLGASQKIFEILDSEPEVVDKKIARPMPRIQGRVAIRNLCFHYREDQEILKGISLDVKLGEMVALVGPSGAGKTTLVHLLQRFYNPTEGEIEIDGIPIQDVQMDTYRAQIGLVPQETLLFGGEIEENIRYAKPEAALNEIIAAAKAANAHQFITEFPDGYNTVVGEKGIKLSAGQRQRIAIARAILKNPRILILDEATSALDNESETLIQEALEGLMRERTTFIIAHRLSTIYKADKIVVLDYGKIVEVGTHAELLTKKGLYHYLYTLRTFESQRGVQKIPT